MGFQPNTLGDVPGEDAVVVTPSNSVNLTGAPRALFVGGAGNISLVTAAGNTVVFTGVAAGSILPVRVQRVNLTDTTATNIVAIY
jgi:hypothetical protein